VHKDRKWAVSRLKLKKIISLPYWLLVSGITPLMKTKITIKKYHVSKTAPTFFSIMNESVVRRRGKKNPAG
jgi:hypothetical protein